MAPGQVAQLALGKQVVVLTAAGEVVTAYDDAWLHAFQWGVVSDPGFTAIDSRGTHVVALKDGNAHAAPCLQPIRNVVRNNSIYSVRPPPSEPRR